MLTAGSGLARLIGALSVPVLTRIYSPEDFAVFAFFTSIVIILSPLASLRYPAALPLPRHDAVAANLFALSLVVSAMSTVILLLVVGTLGPMVLAKFSMQSLIPWRWFIVVAIVAGALSEMLNFWVIRKRDFKLAAKNEVWQMGLASVAKIGLGLVSVSPAGLFLGQTFSKFGSIVHQYRNVRGDLWAQGPQINWTRIRKMAHIYRRYPIYRVPSQLLLNMSLQAPMLLFVYFFEKEVAGQLSLAMIAIALPVSLIANTSGNAFFAEISKLGPKKPAVILHQTIVVLKAMAVISIFPTAIMLFFGPAIFEIVFGAEWRQAGLFSSILSINLLTQFLITPVVRVLAVVGLDRLYLFINLQFLIIILFAFVPAAIWELGPVQTVYIFSAAISAHRVLVILYIVSLMRGLTRKCASAG